MQKLSDNQAKALAALLTHKTVKEAAAAVGISERTLYRYFTLDNFKEALKEAQGILIADVTRRLAGMADDSLSKLYDLMSSGESDTVKCRAATTLLSNFLRFNETLTLEQRLSELESRVDNE